MIERREAATANDRRLRGEEPIDRPVAGRSESARRPGARAGAATDGIVARIDRDYRENLRRDLFTRKPYPNTADAWRQLLEAMATVPQVLFYQIRLSLESTIRALLDMTVLGAGPF